MKRKKINSTNSLNENYWNERCGIANTLSVIGGRWKINILTYLLNEHRLRFSELKKRLVGISERMLVAKLKELENDGLIKRIVHAQVPPKVEYELTELGGSLKEILVLMDEWGEVKLTRKSTQKKMGVL